MSLPPPPPPPPASAPRCSGHAPVEPAFPLDQYGRIVADFDAEDEKYGTGLISLKHGHGGRVFKKGASDAREPFRRFSTPVILTGEKKISGSAKTIDHTQVPVNRGKAAVNSTRAREQRKRACPNFTKPGECEYFTKLGLCQCTPTGCAAVEDFIPSDVTLANVGNDDVKMLLLALEAVCKPLPPDEQLSQEVNDGRTLAGGIKLLEFVDALQAVDASWKGSIRLVRAMVANSFFVDILPDTDTRLPEATIVLATSIEQVRTLLRSITTGGAFGGAGAGRTPAPPSRDVRPPGGRGSTTSTVPVLYAVTASAAPPVDVAVPAAQVGGSGVPSIDACKARNAELQTRIGMLQSQIAAARENYDVLEKQYKECHAETLKRESDEAMRSVIEELRLAGEVPFDEVAAMQEAMADWEQSPAAAAAVAAIESKRQQTGVERFQLLKEQFMRCKADQATLDYEKSFLESQLLDLQAALASRRTMIRSDCRVEPLV